MQKKAVLLIMALCFGVLGCAKEDAEVPWAAQVPQTEVIEENEQKEIPGYDMSKMEAYLGSVEESAAEISHFLEHDAMTQDDMNGKSQELYRVWDDALNVLWGELKQNMQEEEFAELLEEQRTWIAEKESAVENAGKEYEGGSIQPLIVNSEAAKITEERVRELFALLKEVTTP